MINKIPENRVINSAKMAQLCKVPSASVAYGLRIVMRPRKTNDVNIPVFQNSKKHIGLIALHDDQEI